MASVNISVADPALDWARSRVESEQYPTVSDYVTDLIEHDRKREAGRLEVAAMLVKAEQSGISKRRPMDIWAEVEAEFKADAGG